MMGVAAGGWRERMGEKLALQRVSGDHAGSYDIEVLARILFAPRSAAGRKRLQAHGRPKDVARDAAGVSVAFGCKDRLYAFLEKLKVERWRRRSRLLQQQHG
jgi:hypothetical protein